MKIKALVLCCFGLASSLSHAAPLNLTEAWNLAKSADTQLLSEQKGFESREEIKAQARAALLPKLSTSFGVFEVENTNSSDAFEQDFDGTSESVSVSLSQPLVNLPAYHGYKASKLELNIIDLQRQLSLQSLMIRLSEAYFALLSAEVSKELAVSEQKAIERQLDQTQQRFKVGLVSKTDVLEAQAAFDQTQVALAIAEQDITINRENLSIIIGGDFESILDIDKTLNFSWDVDQQENWVDDVIQKNLELQVSKLALQQSKRNYQSIKSSYWPSVEAVASYSETDAGSNAENQSIGVQATWVPFQGGGLMSRVRQAQLDFEKAQQDVSGAEIRLKRDANNLYKTLETNVIAIKAQEQATLSSESALEATEAGYEVGTRNVVDVLQAQRSVFRSRKDLALAKYDYILNGLRAEALSGGLGIDDLKTVDDWFR